jgi:hypothetical protein
MPPTIPECTTHYDIHRFLPSPLSSPRKIERSVHVRIEELEGNTNVEIFDDAVFGI